MSRKDDAGAAATDGIFERKCDGGSFLLTDVLDT